MKMHSKSINNVTYSVTRNITITFLHFFVSTLDVMHSEEEGLFSCAGTWKLWGKVKILVFLSSNLLLSIVCSRLTVSAVPVFILQVAFCLEVFSVQVLKVVNVRKFFFESSLCHSTKICYVFIYCEDMCDILLVLVFFM